MSTLLDLLLKLEIDQEPAKHIRCIWTGSEKPATLQEMKRFSLQEAKPPRLSKEPLSLACRGDVPIHFQLDEKRFQHVVRFLSFVHLDITSPPRCIAVYILARLFPVHWHSFYKLAFRQALHHRAESNVNRFNQVMSEPTALELVQMAALFVLFVKCTKETEKSLFDAQRSLFDGTRDVVAEAFGERRTTRFRLTLFLSVATYSLSEKAKRSFVEFLKFYNIETVKNLDLLYEKWRPLPKVPANVYVPCAISLFSLE